jgi:hypothetical protein
MTTSSTTPPSWEPRDDAAGARWTRAVERIISALIPVRVTVGYDAGSPWPLPVKIPVDRPRAVRVIDIMEDPPDRERKHSSGGVLTWRWLRDGQIEIVTIAGLSGSLDYTVTLEIVR